MQAYVSSIQSFELFTVTVQGPRSKFSSGGGGGGGLKDKQVKMSQLGGGGIRGYVPPEIFYFNSSEMPRNAFKINQRNPKIQTFGLKKRLD